MNIYVMDITFMLHSLYVCVIHLAFTVWMCNLLYVHCMNVQFTLQSLYGCVNRIIFTAQTCNLSSVYCMKVHVILLSLHDCVFMLPVWLASPLFTTQIIKKLTVRTIHYNNNVFLKILLQSLIAEWHIHVLEIRQLLIMVS